MNEAQDILTAFRRSERMRVEQVARWESLDFGVAYWSEAYPHLAEANQLRDVWLAEMSGTEALARCDAYYAERGGTCRMWTPASSQAVEPLESMLPGSGWKRIEKQVMNLAAWNAAAPASDPTIRILPARAMRKAYRATFEDGSALSGERAEAAMDRLNDSNLDGFVAVVDGAPAGRISYLSVGDAARVWDLFVLEGFRRRGVGRELMGHVLQLARRLLPKWVVADAGDERAALFLSRAGFAAAGRVVSFER